MKSFLKFFILLILGVGIFSCSKDTGGTELRNSYSADGISSSGSSSGSSAGGSVGSGDTSKYKAGVITAGEWHDLANWNFWKGLNFYLDSTKYMSYWGFNLKQHCILNLTDNFGGKIHDALIVVKNGNNILWEARTDNAGKAVIYVNLFGKFENNFTITATYRGQNFDLGIFPYLSETISKSINTTKINSNNVDMMLVVDATGSMGDELEYLKVELNSVINRVKANASNHNLRMSSVFYRDKGDEYLTRELGFTTDDAALVNFVKNQKAAGGGDFPEAVDEALNVGLKQTWREDAIARILFLVLDAPPHGDEQSMKQKLEDITRLAAKKGVKIVPIVASGIGKETEFLMRFMAMATNGTYVFITDHSGIGNAHLTPTIGSYKVEFLNDLMVRLMQKYTM